MTIRHILDALFIPFIYIYSYLQIQCYLHLFTLTYPYLHLFILIYTYLSILLFSLYYYTNLIRLVKYGKHRNTTKFSRLKSVSSIDDDYLETATGGVL